MLQLWQRRKLDFLRTVFAIVVAVIICRFPLENVEAFFYDSRVVYKPASKTSGHIATIAFNKETLSKFGGEPKARDYADLFRRLKTQKPKAIITTMDPALLEGSTQEISELIETLDDIYFIPLDATPPKKDSVENLRMPVPYDRFFYSIGLKSKDGNAFAKDSVTRRMIIQLFDYEWIYTSLAKKLGFQKTDTRFKGEFSFLGSKQMYVDYRPPGTYKPHAFHEPFSPGQFTDKVVIIGSETGSPAEAYAFTPYSKAALTTPDYEIQANMFDTAFMNSSPQRAPDWVDRLITIAISIVIIYVVMAANPMVGLLTLLATLLVFIGLAWFLFAFGGLWLNMTHPILAIFICYYFSIPYRLIKENRRSWEYFQKHRLLQQVEELKTNFLSMMSHDIKTPIARIQGMADILSSEKERLNPSQKDALGTIQESVEELSGFISTILDLGRIENQKVKLKLKAKDVNSLLEEVIKKHEFLAEKKNITVVTEFEPLFSLSIDVELMRQVFANLVENAIKYSPEGSKVLVSTEEEEGKLIVQIADQGEGIPSEEVENVFMKFYRSKDAKSSTIKGSGLGLYLAKYFVDLHQGSILVESAVGQGSTFTVELPMKS